MKVIFLKVTAMKYYKGVSRQDPAHNGGAFVREQGFGHEEYNFLPVTFPEEATEYCIGFVETKSTTGSTVNSLHIEKIPGVRIGKTEDQVEDVLVIWCATTDLNETSIVGWYDHATVFRHYQDLTFDNGYVQSYLTMAKKKNCVLLPVNLRHRHFWQAPSSRKRGFGFGQSLIWFPKENEPVEMAYVDQIVRQIREYDGENWIDRSVKDEVTTR